MRHLHPVRFASIRLSVVVFCLFPGCEQNNTVVIEHPAGFPIVLDYPDGATEIYGDDNSLDFRIGQSQITLVLALAEFTPPELGQSLENNDPVNDSESIEGQEVRFGEIKGTKWQLSSAGMTYYLLDAPGNYVAVRARDADELILATLEGSFRSLHVEHLP